MCSMMQTLGRMSMLRMSNVQNVSITKLISCKCKLDQPMSLQQPFTGVFPARTTGRKTRQELYGRILIHSRLFPIARTKNLHFSN